MIVLVLLPHELSLPRLMALLCASVSATSLCSPHCSTVSLTCDVLTIYPLAAFSVWKRQGRMHRWEPRFIKVGSRIHHIKCLTDAEQVLYLRAVTDGEWNHCLSSSEASWSTGCRFFHFLASPGWVSASTSCVSVKRTCWLQIRSDKGKKSIPLLG